MLNGSVAVAFDVSRAYRGFMFGSLGFLSFLAKPAPKRGHQPSPMFMASLGKGSWVKNRDMDPATCVNGRVYRTENGEMGRYFPGYFAAGRIEEWFFPDTAQG